MSYIEDLSAITTPSLTDLLYIYQNGTDFKITNQQLLDLIKTNTVIPLTQSDYDDLTPAEKNNGSIYIITDASITADDVEYSSGISVADMLDITDITSTYCTTATGVTLEANDSSVYKQGKHIWGNLQFVIPSSTSQQVIATITNGFQPSKTIIGYAGYSSSKWSTDTIGSLYIGTNKNIACTVSVSGKTYVNIVIDYLTD